MGGYLATLVMKHAKISIEDGKETYKKLFVNFKGYAAWKEQVDMILVSEGYGELVQ